MVRRYTWTTIIRHELKKHFKFFQKSYKLKRTVFFSLVFVIPHAIAQTNIIDEAPKDRLVRTIKNWVAEAEGLGVNNIEVQANDRRFIVPDCDENFDVSFAFGTKTNIQVNCDNKDWRAVLRIQIKKGA